MANYVIGYGPKEGNYDFRFAAEMAAAETRLLRDKLTIAEISRRCGVCVQTMKACLKDGKHNKAWKALKERSYL